MSRFCGVVGYGLTHEDPVDSGIWKDKIIEHEYRGDVIRDTRKLEAGEGVNNNISVGNSISIVADRYAIENFFHIRYVDWAGVLWTVTNVEVKSPRLILSIGSVYNGPTP